MRPEDILQASVGAYLDGSLPRTAWWCAIPNGAVLAGDKAARGRQMAKLKRTGLKVGAPDILVVWEGRAFFLELKAGQGRLSEAQTAVSEALSAAGAGWTVVRSIDDADAYLRFAGLPMRGRLAA